MIDKFSGLSFEPVGCCRCIPYPPVNEGHLLDALNYSIKHMEEHIMNEPDYYAGNGLSPIGAMKQGLISKEEYIGFLKGNIIKYVTRAGHKHNASEDMVKAIDYCSHLKRLYDDEMRVNNDSPVVQESKRIMMEAFEGLDKIRDVEED